MLHRFGAEGVAHPSPLLCLPLAAILSFMTVEECHQGPPQAPPRRPVCLRIGHQIQTQIPPCQSLCQTQCGVVWLGLGWYNAVQCGATCRSNGRTVHQPLLVSRQLQVTVDSGLHSTTYSHDTQQTGCIMATGESQRKAGREGLREGVSE